jgi:signal transduction histidine kinase
MSRRSKRRGSRSPADGRGHSGPALRTHRDSCGIRNLFGPGAIRARNVGRHNLSRMLCAANTPRWLGVVVACVALLVETVAIVGLKQIAPAENFGTVYLLGVLVVAVGWDWGLATVTAVVSALAFGCLRRWPISSFDVADIRNLVVTAVFVVLAFSANALAAQVRFRATELEERRREADRSANQQAALRRVATSVARGAEPADVFSTVATELARAFSVRNVCLYRHDHDDTAVLLAACREPLATGFIIGERFPVQDGVVGDTVWRCRRPARIDYVLASGPGAARARAAGFRSAVAAPIMVDGRVWGAAVVGSTEALPFPPDTEARLADFTDLVAVSIGNVQARLDLTASRKRIVQAADDASRRLERDLHDGAQQRLVSLGIQLRTAKMLMPPDAGILKAQIAEVICGLAHVGEELRDISRGIHPAILTKGGLGAALKGLARRSAVPVELDVEVPRLLPETVAVAAYYVVAEALTNVARHANASVVSLQVRPVRGSLDIVIHDDGIGGADLAQGTGLLGLTDRVEAIGGKMRIHSPRGLGTWIRVNIPCAEEDRSA